MTQGVAERSRLLDHLSEMAPGTPLRDGFERILRGRTGALVVLGHTREVRQLSTGGFPLDVPYSATALRELAKMDGAIILDPGAGRIVGAGVHLTPSPELATVETAPGATVRSRRSVDCPGRSVLG